MEPAHELKESIDEVIAALNHQRSSSLNLASIEEQVTSILKKLLDAHQA